MGLCVLCDHSVSFRIVPYRSVLFRSFRFLQMDAGNSATNADQCMQGNSKRIAFSKGESSALVCCKEKKRKEKKRKRKEKKRKEKKRKEKEKKRKEKKKK